MENLLEEEGAVSFRPGDGLVAEPSRRHSELGLRFARAAGATEDDLRRPLAGSVWLARELDGGRWIGPLAYVSVGMEANVPPAFGVMIGGLREHYGFTDDELVFLTEHCGADELHGARGAEIVAAVASTPEARREALDGARRGGAAWWHFHRKHARALGRA